MKKSKLLRSLSMLIALLMTLSTLTLLPVTSSAEAEFEEVSTAEALHAALEANKNVKLTADITIPNDGTPDDGNWTPIPTYSGVFDGNGKTISNLQIKGSGSTMGLGMFKVLDGATVKNLRLDAYLTFTGASFKTSDVGMNAVLAVMSKGTTTIQNVYLSGTVSVTATGAGYGYGVAGFVSFVQAGTTSIVGCACAMTMTLARHSSPFVAGIKQGAALTLQDCVFTGSVNANNGIGIFASRVGGNLTLERCIDLGKSNDTDNQYQGMLFYLSKDTFATDAAPASWTVPTVALIDCYLTSTVASPVLFGCHASAKGTYNISVKYGDAAAQTVYSTSDTVLPYTVKGVVEFLTPETFATAYPAFDGWVVTTDTVNYGGTDPITKVLPKGIFEMEMAQNVDTEVFANTQYIQTKANSNDATATDVRLVTSVAVDEYDEVGYEVYTKYGFAKTVTTDLYTSILADGQVVKAEGNGMWLALGIDAIPAGEQDTEVFVRPYVKNGDAVSYGKTSSFTLNTIQEQD